jgi:hypothetical protein
MLISNPFGSAYLVPTVYLLSSLLGATLVPMLYIVRLDVGRLMATSCSGAGAPGPSSRRCTSSAYWVGR